MNEFIKSSLVIHTACTVEIDFRIFKLQVNDDNTKAAAKSHNQDFRI